jgi:glutamate-ammonia-ligase adenylyltransferase
MRKIDLPLLVLGMGKLCGSELNFSSDVDLVFVYPDGAAEGSSNVETETYYLRLCQLLIKLLDKRTDDGFAYRVDTRLRPFGSSGPLAVGLSAFEAYLLQHGRDWERYAYVKARLLTGQEFSADVFDYILTPFVYRRYLDYGVFDALRQMKRLIAQEVARKDMADNIKLGPGGIREIEFIASISDRARRPARAGDALPKCCRCRRRSATRPTVRARKAYRFAHGRESSRPRDSRRTSSLRSRGARAVGLRWRAY